jgi:hypothetical protein
VNIDKLAAILGGLLWLWVEGNIISALINAGKQMATGNTIGVDAWFIAEVIFAIVSPFIIVRLVANAARNN